MTEPGLVSIVGAGPGDPGLLTLKGAERLRAAQAVVHDALVRPELLVLAPGSAEVFDVGKRDRRHTMPQEEINRLLVRLSREGKRVVRLKGGDPFLFGRGAEEAEVLARAGLPWEVVPGVSSCLAAPAAAGIPVTHRRLSSMLTVVTGRACEKDEGDPGVDWARISPRGTLVVLMGLSSLPALCARLLACGWPPATPAAALSSMGWAGEAVAVADLAGLPEAVRESGLAAPAVIVLGEVVNMRRALSRRGNVALEAAGRN
ncbi:MAG: uroporphyrinogen-III C-methyltransferase [Elusimicrobiota bacterium]